MPGCVVEGGWASMNRQSIMTTLSKPCVIGNLGICRESSTKEPSPHPPLHESQINLCKHRLASGTSRWQRSRVKLGRRPLLPRKAPGKSKQVVPLRLAAWRQSRLGTGFRRRHSPYRFGHCSRLCHMQAELPCSNAQVHMFRVLYYVVLCAK